MRKVTRVLLLLSFVLAAVMPMTSQAQSNCDLSNGVLVGTLAYGINCLDDAGWHEYEIKSGSVLTVSSIDDVAICPETGDLLLMHIFGISVFDGANWSDLDVPSDVFASNAVACAPNGNIWIAHGRGLSRYNGSEWTTFAKEDFGSSPFIFGVDDVAVSANGIVWAATSSSVAKYNDGVWQVFENGSGFNQDYTFGQLVLNSDGLPTVAHSSGLLTFNGETWTNEAAPISGVSSILVDADNRIWVGSRTEGVAVLDQGEWEVYDGLSSNKVNGLTSDAQGRVWVSTEWGLNVLDGDTWTAYQMGNSDLLDNNIQKVTVLGDGPALPEPIEKAPGSIIGVIENGRDPLPDTEVELCTESVGGVFYGDTPCEGQVGRLLVTTDASGEFVFENVPAGRYDLTINTPEGWIYFVGVNAKVIVEAGEETDLADIDVSN